MARQTRDQLTCVEEKHKYSKSSEHDATPALFTSTSNGRLRCRATMPRCDAEANQKSDIARLRFGRHPLGRKLEQNSLLLTLSAERPIDVGPGSWH